MTGQFIRATPRTHLSVAVYALPWTMVSQLEVGLVVVPEQPTCIAAVRDCLPAALPSAPNLCNFQLRLMMSTQVLASREGLRDVEDCCTAFDAAGNLRMLGSDA